MLDTQSTNNRLLRALKGELTETPPLWLMRQAGRYLPEYREIRTKVGSFLELCGTPELAAEVTLQPLRRFDLDAAIIFSDILIVPFALGQQVEFVKGEGPKLDPITDGKAIAKLERKAAGDTFAPVYEALRRVRAELDPDTALIGFCGAPWTVATYMIAGGGSKDQAEARALAYSDPEAFAGLIDLLVDVSAGYLIEQVKAGAQVLQIFDSWSGSLAEDEFARWSIGATKALVAKVKAEVPDVPIIGFPKGAGPSAIPYARRTGIDAIGCDTSLPLRFIADNLQNLMPVQGNLDPVLLMAGGEHLDRRVGQILEALGDRPFVFNLGHGILPQTPPEHVSRLVSLVRSK
ncbi:Uroporphyrinogen decarboxylase [Methyloligella halotolerans]|uniref:Uroporphyrinogen decarboxylase n=1 Tax=Methyloligella halotolerans TaxID=1177755 RepID=A0A1E2S0N9_9HYPH|nr:uroporphyrinogen decarboxylase [Methyloligella halotolerans]ODA68031.1 Uroporphyrinogen decarboxylase [Methyloligella halotolerans]